MNVRKKDWMIAVGLVLLLAVSALACRALSARRQPESVPVAEVGSGESDIGSSAELVQYAPDFTMLDADGNVVRLSDFTGTPVLVNFWATWCPPCRAELPAFDVAFQTYGSSIQFLMVDLADGVQETEKSARAFVAENGYTFPVYYNTDGSAVSAYRLYAVPQTVAIDAEGRIVRSHTGALSEEMLSGLLEALSA